MATNSPAVSAAFTLTNALQPSATFPPPGTPVAIDNLATEVLRSSGLAPFASAYTLPTPPSLASGINSLALYNTDQVNYLLVSVPNRAATGTVTFLLPPGTPLFLMASFPGTAITSQANLGAVTVQSYLSTGLVNTVPCAFSYYLTGF